MSDRNQAAETVMLAAQAEARDSLKGATEQADGTARQAAASVRAQADRAFETQSSAASAALNTARTQGQHTMESAMKTAEDFLAFGQGNMEAMMKSGQIWATGVQDLSKQMSITAQTNLDETMSAFRAASGLKSVRDLIDLQAGFARTAMEKAMAETGRLTDASLKLAEQAMAPITARVTLAVETMVKPA